MKKITILIQLILCFSSIYAENKVPSIVKEVTVYPSGAKITSVAEVKLAAGNNDIVFEKMPLDLNILSLQIRIKGSSKLVSANFRTFTSSNSKNNESKSRVLNDSLVLIQDNLTKIDIENTLLAQEEQLLLENQRKVGSYPNNGNNLSINDLKELSAYCKTRMTEIKSRSMELVLLRRKTQKLQYELGNKLNSLNINDAQTTGEIVLQLNSPIAQTSEIACVYLVSNASWTPIYDIRAESIEKPLTLVSKASIKNCSGLDWKNVLLHLSSALPFSNNNRPILSPKYIDFSDSYSNSVVSTYGYLNNSNVSTPLNMAQIPQREARIKGSRNENTIYMVDGIRVNKEKLPPAEEINQPIFGSFEKMYADEENFSETFDVKDEQTVLNNTKAQVMEYKTQDIPAVYEYHSVPKIDPSVFLLAKITDYGKYNLISGNANIFYKDTYIGQSYIDTKNTGDTLLLSLGRDEDISIKRLKPMDLKSEKKFFSDSRKERLGFEIVVKNNKNIPIEIEILDQIPVSRSKEIVVNLEEKGGADYNETYGKLSWKLKIPERKNKTVRFEYSVKSPKSKVVN